MALCYFVSDLHGNPDRFEKLFLEIRKEKPAAVFFGGDVLPSGLYAFTSSHAEPEVFVRQFLHKLFSDLKNNLKEEYPEFFLIMGNDDARIYESLFIELEEAGFINYAHDKVFQFNQFEVYGYSYVPPTPFTLKDWEKYDVSRYIDPGCIPPEDGSFTVEVDKKALQYETIRKDLERLVVNDDLSKSIFLFHTPPYKTKLDRAGLDGKFYDHVPLDVHVGSIAVERFIKDRQPLITLHGHIHESTSITGSWYDFLGDTLCMNASHDGPELSIIRFDPENPDKRSRTLL
jgi:Icc-related predicted phosphoesterase